MILLLVTITFGCLMGADPLPEENQENKTSSVVSPKPLLYDGFLKDFLVVSLIFVYPLLFLDGTTSVNAPDTPWFHSARLVWVFRFLVDLYFYEEPIPVIRPMPQCRPPWPQHLLEPEVIQPLEPREQLIRFFARYKLRVLLQYLGII